METIKCKICGKTFNAVPSQKAQYCSKKCSYKREYKKGENHHGWLGGHSKEKGGYISCWTESGKRKRMHQIIIENIIGRKLPDGACIHHIDGNKQNNDNKNLVVCDSHSYHRLIHAREKILIKCGNANKRKCKYCKEYDYTENMYFNKSGRSHFHRKCAAEHHRNRKLKIKQNKQQEAF